ncbi:CoA transferase [Caproiciproducens sp. NJN-50]|uniref:CaiB/BaiF CoA transferase family protein n=1 Tax=Acutalibacteraceae TaxID=3082771 RepID=UPI000FFE1FEE|nr:MULTISPECIES: CaiB/BaiF CoA-transferase family protein [Acutalibacteraceae]QAT50085.1 CoA transferase [Caproiciproducens sp. NJN-50]
MKPLEGMLVLDFSQLLAGPYAGLRLADLGARVVKIENPNGGDLSRKMALSNLYLDGENSLFHTENRNKESLVIDLKDPSDRGRLDELLSRADVMLINFRPGVAERLGVDYESVKKINPALVYGEVTGYGKKGPWVGRPGQDLLVQAVSGIAYQNGNADQPPLPVGLSVADILAGEHLIQGVMAGLVRRGVTGRGAYVEVSLLESALDLQFEGLTTFLNDGHELPVRSGINNASPFIAAPYGIYRTKNGYLALAMGSIPTLAELLKCDELKGYTDKREWSSKRDEIKMILAEHLLSGNTEEWLAVLEPADIWCSDVMDWDRLMKTEEFQTLDMTQEVVRSNGTKIETLRCPIRIDGEKYKCSKGSPRLDEHDPDLP